MRISIEFYMKNLVKISMFSIMLSFLSESSIYCTMAKTRRKPPQTGNRTPPHGWKVRTMNGNNRAAAHLSMGYRCGLSSFESDTYIT